MERLKAEKTEKRWNVYAKFDGCKLIQRASPWLTQCYVGSIF